MSYGRYTEGKTDCVLYNDWNSVSLGQFHLNDLRVTAGFYSTCLKEPNIPKKTKKVRISKIILSKKKTKRTGQKGKGLALLRPK